MSLNVEGLAGEIRGLNSGGYREVSDITEYSKSKGLNPSLMTAALPAYDGIRRCCVYCGIFIVFSRG